MLNTKYLVDSSLLIRREEFEEYEIDAFPTHWYNFDRLVECGVISSLNEVRDEITLKGYDYFNNWVKQYDFLFKNLDKSSLNYLNEVLSYSFPNWIKKLESEDKLADAYLIAYAKVHNITLVTQEVYNLTHNTKEKNYKIPTICELIGGKCVMKSCDTNYKYKNFDFECICFNELIKREHLYKPNLF
ncbi:DUF4411 family protein [uncultured Methanobrevibacter sp.]|uniref:DUF4411 family protein n=1 Tax=uncultured Methanobrevibacter sp. TaxID=253161 RepID=UPI0026298E09